jgi:hypothetical protein
MKDEEIVPVCGNTPMVRDYQAEHPSITGTEKGETFWSDSLAINPDQTAEHQRQFPDVKVDADGRLGFDSNKVRDKYLDATGFTKKSQRKEIV